MVTVTGISLPHIRCRPILPHLEGEGLRLPQDQDQRMLFPETWGSTVSSEASEFRAWRNAVELYHWGMTLFPLVDDGKTPRFQGWQSQRCDLSQLMNWVCRGWNLGMVTGSLVVVDLDNREQLGSLTSLGCVSGWQVVTRRGLHLYFRHPDSGEVRNRQGAIDGVDVRGHGGFVVAPGSVIGGHEYRWVSRAGEMPTYRPDWFPRSNWAASSSTYEARIKSQQSAWNYIKEIYSVSGQRGHDACYRAVRWLKDFELSRDQAMSLLVVWNMQNAQPPWSERELEHKVNSVYGA